MRIHFLNGDVKEDITPEEVQELVNQMTDDPPTFLLIKEDNKIKYIFKSTQILYID